MHRRLSDTLNQNKKNTVDWKIDQAKRRLLTRPSQPLERISLRFWISLTKKAILSTVPSEAMPVSRSKSKIKVGINESVVLHLCGGFIM